MMRVGDTRNDGQPVNKPVQNRNLKPKLNESLFLKLDKDKDGRISDEELIVAGYKGNDFNAVSEAIFFAERDVNKWFMLDKNKDGVGNNAEMAMWDIHNSDDNHKIGDLTPEEFAKKNNIKTIQDDLNQNFENWCKHWIENDNPMAGIKAIVKERYGKELSDDEMQLLYDVMKSQANRWLFKKDALYNRLNLDAYTRLVTTDQTVSCCGGDVSKPPIGPQNPEEGCVKIFGGLEENGSTNSAFETKNRLAWAAFKTIPQDKAAKMTEKEYSEYQADWNRVRNMTAADFRELLKPENRASLEKFEKTSNMTVKQIVDYIDIVENATGKDFDSNDWELDTKIFHENVMRKVNGTFGDETILEGKTRADIPQERQNLLKYLETHGLLLEQFKD